MMNWDWQEWGVALLIIVCVVRIGYSIFVFFRRLKKKESPCGSCATGCALKTQLDQKDRDGEKEKLPEKKNCCR